MADERDEIDLLFDGLQPAVPPLPYAELSLAEKSRLFTRCRQALASHEHDRDRRSAATSEQFAAAYDSVIQILRDLYAVSSQPEQVKIQALLEQEGRWLATAR